jgi:hypothetical protein
VFTVSLFAAGTAADGSSTFAARVLTLHGQELGNLGHAAIRLHNGDVNSNGTLTFVHTALKNKEGPRNTRKIL